MAAGVERVCDRMITTVCIEKRDRRGNGCGMIAYLFAVLFFINTR